MYFKTVLLVLSLILLTFETQAQPGRYKGFSPKDQCLSFSKDDIIFVGKLTSIRWISNNSWLSDILKNDSSVLEMTISIERVINGKLDKKNSVKVFSQVFLPDLINGDMRIFAAREFTDSKNTKSLVSNRWSDRLNMMDLKEQGDILLNIESRFKEIPISAISGKVVQRNDSMPLLQTSLLKTNGDLSKIGTNTNFFTSVKGITVEAKRAKDAKSFRTRTDANGNYKFLDLEEGSYKIYLISTKGFQEVDNGFKNVIYTIQKNSEKDRCYRQVFFEIKQITN